METTKRVVVICPYCAAENNRHSGVTDPEAVPKTGDLALCFDCGGAYVFAFAAKGNSAPITEDQAREMFEQSDVDYDQIKMLMKFAVVERRYPVQGYAFNNFPPGKYYHEEKHPNGSS